MESVVAVVNDESSSEVPLLAAENHVKCHESSSRLAIAALKRAFSEVLVAD